MHRCKLVYCFALVVSIAATTRGDVTYSKAKDGENEIDVVKMTVTPAAESVPALRFRLIAHDIDLKRGNAAPYYYRAQLNLHQTMKQIRDKFDEEKELSLWYDTGDEATPIRELPLEKVRQANQMFDSIYNEYLKPAFEYRDCDWNLGVEELRGPDIMRYLLPEFQDSREIARMMALRTRLAIAEHRYDDAVETMRNQYRLGRDQATVPFLVCGLIGIAIDGVANGTLIDFIANPDSPNMYWALAQLPEPPVDLRPAARFEMNFVPRLFPFIHKAETTDRSPQEWNRLFAHSMRDLKKVVGTPDMGGVGFPGDNDLEAGVAATALGLLGYTHAKERLIASGMDRKRVEKMAVGQVLAIYTERICRRFSDDAEKLWYVPYPEMEQANRDFTRRLSAASLLGADEDREVWPLMGWLMPSMTAVRSAQMRLEREVAALRVIEALRMHAAAHDGKLPNSLADVEVVPVPPNPATGKPFVYRLDGTTAVLDLPASDQIKNGNRRYEIQIAVKK